MSTPKLRQTNVVLKKQARKMVYDVYSYIKEKEEGRSETDTIKRAAEATKTSRNTVLRIIDEAKTSNTLTAFRTPGKKRSGKKKVTEIDSFDQSVIIRCVHNYQTTYNEVPSVEKLRKKLKEDINYTGSDRSLRRILNSLGFRFKRTENNQKLLLEKSNIRLLRIEYLQKITKYREEGRPIVYTDESYVDAPNETLAAVTTTKGVKKPVTKGQHVVIVHAASEAGFVPNALLLFKAATKTGDNHVIMNFEDNYEKWVQCQLLPNLPPNSVVVIDNAPYHNKQSDLAPSTNSKKCDMQIWLQDKGLEYSDNMLKPQLYKIIKSYKEQHKSYKIDKILNEHGHTVLRLPPYHSDLNPVEMAWSSVKEYVASQNVSGDVKKVMQLVKEKVATMGTSEWEHLCRIVQEIEKEYIKNDHVIDLVTDEYAIFDDDDSDSDDEDDDDDEDDAGHVYEEPTSDPLGDESILPS